MLQKTLVVTALAGALGAHGAHGAWTAQDSYRNLQGKVVIDGSSTVSPITSAVAEEFSNMTGDKVRVTVAVSGTGGGFKRFVIGETDISNASRPIKAKERDEAKKNGVEFIELPVAYDGLTIVVHPSNSWAEEMTVDDLKKIFLAESAAKTWQDVRPEWPASKIKVYAPGTDSGTFDYFKEVVAGDKSIRSDMSVSEDDNVLVTGVAGDENSVGFFGFAYYVENKDKLKAVKIVNPETGKGVMPTHETVEGGEYAPFSRPLFIYVNKESAKRPEVAGYVRFYLDEGPELVEEVGYIKLPTAIYKKAQSNFKAGKAGTHFLTEEGESKKGNLTTLYGK